MWIKKFNEGKTRGGNPISTEKSPISDEEIMECFQDYQDHVSGLEISSVFMKGTISVLKIDMFYDNVGTPFVRDGNQNVDNLDNFKKALDAQKILLSCVERFESMYDCKISNIAWAPKETILRFDLTK
jgi:hypothetical protein